jgi:hypothetical protein
MSNQKLEMKIDLKILPFGSMQIEMKGGEKPTDVREKKPIYGEPISTNRELIEISFGGGDEYVSPQTTGGLF